MRAIYYKENFFSNDKDNLEACGMLLPFEAFNHYVCRESVNSIARIFNVLEVLARHLFNTYYVQRFRW